MEHVYAVPGAVTMIEWFLAATLYAFGWYRAKERVNGVADSLVVAGGITSLAGVAWLAWDVSPGLAMARGTLATGLALSALAIYAVLGRRRTERLSALMVLGFAIPAQAYAVGRLWWGVEVAPRGVFLPLWMVLRTLAGLVGYGALGVGAVVIVLAFALYRAKDRIPADRFPAAVGLSTLEWQSARIALVALSGSLSLSLIRSWWGLGRALEDGLAWTLATWLLLAAAAYGLMQGVIPRRLARALLVLAFATAIVAVLTLAG